MVKLEEVILSTESTRGSGKDTSSPVRAIFRLYSKNGDLIAEQDPLSYPIEAIAEAILAAGPGIYDNPPPPDMKASEAGLYIVTKLSTRVCEILQGIK